MKEELNEDKKKPKIGTRSELFLPYVCPNMSVCTQPYFSTSTRERVHDDPMISNERKAIVRDKNEVCSTNTS